jgi:hypothetical protein
MWLSVKINIGMEVQKILWLRFNSDARSSARARPHIAISVTSVIQDHDENENLNEMHLRESNSELSLMLLGFKSQMIPTFTDTAFLELPYLPL